MSGETCVWSLGIIRSRSHSGEGLLSGYNGVSLDNSITKTPAFCIAGIPTRWRRHAALETEAPRREVQRSRGSLSRLGQNALRYLRSKRNCAIYWRAGIRAVSGCVYVTGTRNNGIGELDVSNRSALSASALWQVAWIYLRLTSSSALLCSTLLWRTNQQPGFARSQHEQRASRCPAPSMSVCLSVSALRLLCNNLCRVWVVESLS